VNLNNIHYFFALAETLNFTAAAEKCYITQTAMSRYITNLEEDLGVKLFDRTSHSVKLTECGRIYLHEMKGIHRDYESLKVHLKAVGNNYQGSIKIGVGLYEYQFVEKGIIKFIKACPEIKIELYRNGYGEVIPWLKSGSLDVIFVADYCAKSFHQNELITQNLYKGKKVLVMNRDIADRYRDRSIEDILSEEKIITNSEDDGPYSYESIKEFFLHAIGFIPPRIVQTNSQRLQFLMAEMGYGVLLVPAFLGEIDYYDLVRREVHGVNEDNYQLMRLVKNRNPVIDLFIEYINNNDINGINRREKFIPRE